MVHLPMLRAPDGTSSGVHAGNKIRARHRFDAGTGYAGRRSIGRSRTISPIRGRLLALAWIGLTFIIGGCAHGDWWAPIAEEQLPAPADPAYAAEVLKARAEYVRAVERWQRALEALDRLIEVRRAARVSRDSTGRIVGISEDLELPRWRLEMERELMRAQGALSRLERRVRADFNGEFPPWWPHDDG